MTNIYEGSWLIHYVKELLEEVPPSQLSLKIVYNEKRVNKGFQQNINPKLKSGTLDIKYKRWVIMKVKLRPEIFR